ncbi:MAG: hypothetical protein HKN43_01370 [Rhodothermales bacterium]|nr:hypothetical protein [Rhodothermales bacterium]
MRIKSLRVAGVAFTLALFGPLTSTAQNVSTDADTLYLMSAQQWADFNSHITRAVVSENPGVVEGGLRQVIRYGELLNLSRSCIFDIMRIYRNHDDVSMRILAIRALGNSNDRWAIEFLDMIVEWEDNPTLKKTIQGVVSDFWTRHGGNPYREYVSRLDGQ